MFSISLYLFSNIENLNLHSLNIDLFWIRFSYLSAFFIATSFVYFTLAFSSPQQLISHRYIPYLLYIPAFAFLSLFNNNSLISGIYFTQSIKIIKYGYLFSIFSLCFLGFFCFGTVRLIQIYLQAKSPLPKIQAAYILTGVFVGGFFGLTVNIILPLFKIQVYPLTSLSLMILAFFTTYALIRQRPLDIEVILKKSIFYYSLTIIIIGAYVLGVVNLGAFLGELIGSSSIIVESLLIVAIAFIFKPLADTLDSFLDSKLFPHHLDLKKVLPKFSESLIYCVEITKLTSLLINTVTDALKIKKSYIFLKSREDNMLKVASAKGLAEKELIRLKIKPSNPFLLFLIKHPKLWQLEHLRDALLEQKESLKIIDQLSAKEASLIIPLVIKEKIIGLFVLGEKLSETIYSEEELELLSTIANQSALALENALVYEDMKETDIRLNQAERLAALGEFSAGLAHEIRNPLENIKGSAEILKTSSPSKEEKDKFTKYIIEEVNRLNNLVSKFLEFAKPQEPDLKRINLNQLLKEVLTSTSPELLKHKIKLKTLYEEDLPETLVDPNLFKQVFLNLIINAWQAMKEGGELMIRTSVQREEPPQVTIEFEDTGEGIAKEDLSQIFNPFFTTKEAGCGLGLAIVQQIIGSHQGKIEVRSKEETKSGITIIIKLPLIPSHNFCIFNMCFLYLIFGF